MPVFIFSLVLLIYLLKVMHFQEIIHFESCKNLAALSWESQLGGAGFGERMFESRVYHDVQDKVSKEINISAEVEAIGEVYIADISYPIDINVPFGSAVCSVHNNTVNVGTDEETRYTYITGFGAIYSPATSGDLVYIKITLMGDTVSKCNTYILDNGYILSDGSSEEEPLNTPTTYYFNKTYPTKIVGII